MDRYQGEALQAEAADLHQLEVARKAVAGAWRHPRAKPATDAGRDLLGGEEVWVLAKLRGHWRMLQP